MAKQYGWKHVFIVLGVGSVLMAMQPAKEPPRKLSPEEQKAVDTKHTLDYGYFDCKRALVKRLRDEDSWKETSNHYNGKEKNGHVMYMVTGTAKNSFNATGKIAAVCDFKLEDNSFTIKVVN